MVTTLRPKASDTPTNPMPTCGKPAAITALPHPAKVSQNVPIASAAYFFVVISRLPGCFESLNARNGPVRGSLIEETGAVWTESYRFSWLSGARNRLLRWTFAVLSDTSARSGLRARLFAGPLLYQNSYPIN